VLNNRTAIIAVTALAPAIWGTTYLVTTEFLPPDRPLLSAALRALPAGLLLVLLTRRLPKGSWWWRALVLGALNIGGFFALLFVAAYRLPGGVAAIVLASQPLMVAGLSSRLLGERLTRRTTIAAAAGLAGVALLVLRADARLDGVGVAAAVGGAVVMAIGVVLSKRWPSPAPLLATTGWQLVAGGLLLVPVVLLLEAPLPTTLSTPNLLGYGYLTIIGGAVAYPIWFRGIRALTPTRVTFLGLLSPVVATALGWLALDQQLTAAQALGGLVVLAAIVLAQTRTSPTLSPSGQSPDQVHRGVLNRQSRDDDRGGQVCGTGHPREQTAVGQGFDCTLDLRLARLDQQAAARCQPCRSSLSNSPYDIEPVRTAVECGSRFEQTGLGRKQPDRVAGYVGGIGDQDVDAAMKRGRQRLKEIAGVGLTADGADVAASEEHSDGIDVDGVQLDPVHDGGQCRADRTRAAAHVDDDSLRVGESGGLMYEEFGTAARHEDSWPHGDAQPAELRPAKDLLERSTGDTLVHQIGERDWVTRGVEQ